MAAAPRFSQGRVYYDELMTLGQYAIEHPKYSLEDQQLASAHITERMTVIAKAVFGDGSSYAKWDKRLHHPSLAFFAALCTVNEDDEAPIDKIMPIAMELLKKFPEVKTNPYAVAQKWCVGNKYSVKHENVVVAFNRKGNFEEHEYTMHSAIIASALWNVLHTVADFDGPIAKAAGIAAKQLLEVKKYGKIDDIPCEKRIVQGEHVVLDKPKEQSPPSGWENVD